jgi:hypothetical protein
MQYFSEKVISVNNKLFTTTELIYSANGTENIVVLRQVERKSHNYTHPVKGTVSVQRYERVSHSPKACLKEQEWRAMEDVNTDHIAVDVQN